MTSFGGSPLCKRHKTVSKVQSDDITPWTTTVPKEKYVTVLKEETAKASSNCRNEPEQRSITLPLSDERIDDGEIKFSDIRIHPELQTSKSDEKILSEDLKDGSASSQSLQFENQSTLAVSSKDTNGDLPLSQTVEPGNGLASVLSSKNNADALQKLIADQVNQAVIPAVAKAMVLASVSMATKTTAKEQPMTSEPPQLLDFCGQTESSAKVDEPDSSTSSTSTDREFIQLTGAHVDGIEIELNNIPNDVESLHQEQSILSPSTMVSVNSLPFKEIVAPWTISDVVPESEKISFMENVPYHTSTEDDLNVQLRAPCENRVENFQTVSATSTRLNESRSPSHLDINTTIVDAVVANDTQKLRRQEKAEREVETNLIGKNKRATVDDASIKRFSKADIFGIGPSIGCYSPGESNADVHKGSHCEYESLRTDDRPRYKSAATEQNATQSSVGLDPNENSVLDKAEIAPDTNLLGKEPTTIASTSNTSNSHSDITNIMNNTKYTVSNQESAVVFLSTAMVHKIGTSTARSMTTELRTEVPCDDVDLTCDQERSAHKAKQIMPRAELSDNQQVPEDVFAEITNLNNTLCSTPAQQDTALELAIPLVAETHLKTDICSKEQTDTTVKGTRETETMLSNIVYCEEHTDISKVRKPTSTSDSSEGHQKKLGYDPPVHDTSDEFLNTRRIRDIIYHAPIQDENDIFLEISSVRQTKRPSILQVNAQVQNSGITAKEKVISDESNPLTNAAEDTNAQKVDRQCMVTSARVKGEQPSTDTNDESSDESLNTRQMRDITYRAAIQDKNVVLLETSSISEPERSSILRENVETQNNMVTPAAKVTPDERTVTNALEDTNTQNVDHRSFITSAGAKEEQLVSLGVSFAENRASESAKSSVNDIQSIGNDSDDTKGYIAPNNDLHEVSATKEEAFPGEVTFYATEQEETTLPLSAPFSKITKCLTNKGVIFKRQQSSPDKIPVEKARSTEDEKSQILAEDIQDTRHVMKVRTTDNPTGSIEATNVMENTVFNSAVQEENTKVLGAPSVDMTETYSTNLVTTQEETNDNLTLRKGESMDQINCCLLK